MKTDLEEKLIQEAQIQNMEARCHKKTVHEIYQGLGIQKGNWNGARPVIEKYRALSNIKEELIKDVATEFFYFWVNSKGTNPDQGFDDWWKINRLRFGYCDKDILESNS